MWTRRQFLTRGALPGLFLAGTGFSLRALSNDDDRVLDGSQARGMITSAAQGAIDRGLAYLERNQNQNGSFGSGQFVGNIAITSLGGLALMAGGHQPGRGRYGRIVTNALRYVLDVERQNQNQQPGFLSNGIRRSHGPMYEHGFGTLFLAEAQGMVHDRHMREQLHGALRRAVDLIIRSQNQMGGWRYNPQPADADISVTICQIMALRAARNAGFAIPRHVRDRCISYVEQCQDIHGDGGFRYMNNFGPTGFARTAAGVVALYSAGVYNSNSVQRGLEYLMRNCRPGQGHQVQGFGRQDHYYYGHYYAVQAMWIAGGRYWAEWFPAIRDELVNHPDHMEDGSWNGRMICPHYSTAMACIILQVPNNYLPIFQR